MTKKELIALLDKHGWAPHGPDRYVRGNSFVVFMNDALIRYFDGTPVSEEDDTMRTVSGTMSLDAAVAWILRRS